MTPLLRATMMDVQCHVCHSSIKLLVPPLQGLCTIVMSIMDTVGGVMSIMILFWRWSHVDNDTAGW